MGPAPTIETSCIETAPGLVFDVSVAGRDDAPLVLMLHGFCVSRYFWHNQMPALAAGYFAMAPNQRGYSAGARPDPADFDNYRVDRLIGDALDIAAATGHGGRHFHLVGHDWGGSLAWLIADRYPERLASLTMLSRPHPASFARALAMPDGEQAHRSRHHRECPTRVPTLFIWGDADDTVGRAAAEGTAEFITADYRFAALPGVGHYAADQVPQQVTALLLDHLARHPV